MKSSPTLRQSWKVVLSACLLMGLTHISFSQDFARIDSLENHYQQIPQLTEEKLELAIEIASEYARFDSVKTFQLAHEILAGSAEIKFEQGEARAYALMGRFYANTGQFDSAKYYYSTSLTKAKAIDFNGGMAAAYQSLAMIVEMEGAYDQSLIYLDSALTNIMGDQSDKGLLIKYNIFNAYGLNFYGQGELDTALYYFHEALSIAQARNDKMTLGITYGNLGLVYDEKTDRVKAIENHKKSEEVARQISDTIGIGYAYQNQGLIYLGLEELDTAKYYFEQAFQLFNQQNLVYEQSGALGGLGYIYQKKGLATEALNTYHQAYQIDLQVGYELTIIQTELSISNIHLIAENYDSADIYIDRAIERVGTEMESMLAECWILKGKIAIKQNQLAEALTLLLRGKSLSEKYKRLDHLTDALKWLSYIKEQQKLYQEAFEFQKQYVTLSDSLNSDEVARKIARAENLYELDKNQKSISLLQRENQIVKAEQEIQEATLRQQNLRNLMIAGSVGTVILIIALFIYFQYRQRNKYAQLVEEKNVQLSETMASKEKLFSIIAHDLKSPLSAFSSISSTLAQNIEAFDKDQIARFLKKFETSSQNLTDLLNNLLQWSLSQTGSLKVQPEVLDIKTSMERAIRPLKDLAESKGITLMVEGESDTIAADARMLETIIRNLVSNALKFTDQGGSVKLFTEKRENTVIVNVTDTGIGMDPQETAKLFDVQHDPGKIGDHEEKGTGLGLILSRELVEKNHGEIGVRSEKNKGTTFFFTLPLAA